MIIATDHDLAVFAVLAVLEWPPCCAPPKESPIDTLDPTLTLT